MMPMLEAGRELDQRVAEKAMGWRTSSHSPLYGDAKDGERFFIRPDGASFKELAVPHYSTDIAAAWQVAELFDEMELRHGPSGWLCRLERGDDEHVQFGESLRAETAPLAICRAALAAVGLA